MHENSQKQQFELDAHERVALDLPKGQEAWSFDGAPVLLETAEAARQKLLNRSQEMTMLAAGGLRSQEVANYWRQMGIINKVVQQLQPYLPSPATDVETFLRNH